MLQSLYLRDFVIVERTEIDFSAGFCVLTGETGAGKSILLDALGLALGNRADAGMVREGARQTEVSAAFKPSASVRTWLEEHELVGDDSTELQLRRLVRADGGSKAFINGSPVTIGQLRALGEQLIEIHGQHASQSLLIADGQRRLLDGYAKAEPLAQAVREVWVSWRDARRLLEQAASRQHELAAEREDLQWRLDEIAAIGPGISEWESLSAEQIRLANGAELIETTQAASAALIDDDDSLSDRLGHLIARLRQQTRNDPSLGATLDMLESAQIQLVEAASDLGGYAQRTDLDPARLAEVEARVGAMFSLARKLRCVPDDLEAKALEMTERLTTLNNAQDLAKLQAEVSRLAGRYDDVAQSLGKARRTAAKKITAAVAPQLASLGMPHARFDIAIETADPGPQGTDQIEFRFAGHESLTPRALNRVASGGELSRVSLAIAVCAAQANPVDSLIFDEADAGVGGAVADAIGRLMRELGEARQVLAVTHLPQVAARAHRHFRIERETTARGINSRVELLQSTARTDEIARMLGGAKITTTTREHAAELIAMGALAIRDNQTSTANSITKTAIAKKVVSKKPAADMTKKRPAGNESASPTGRGPKRR